MGSLVDIVAGLILSAIAGTMGYGGWVLWKMRAVIRFSPSWGVPPAADPMVGRRVDLTFDGWLSADTELTFQEWLEAAAKAPSSPAIVVALPKGGTAEVWADPSMARIRAEFHRLLAEEGQRIPRGAEVATGVLRSSVPYAGAIDPPSRPPSHTTRLKM